MRGRLNYIELRVVTQRIYERPGKEAEGWTGEGAGGTGFIVRAFGYV